MSLYKKEMLDLDFHTSTEAVADKIRKKIARKGGPISIKVDDLKEYVQLEYFFNEYIIKEIARKGFLDFDINEGKIIFRRK